MKKHEIDAIFTAKVQECLVKGYAFSTTTMSGHQGEIAKVDVTNGKEIIRIMLDSIHEWNHKDCRETEAVVLIVGRATENFKRRPHCNPFDITGPTIWSTSWKSLRSAHSTRSVATTTSSPRTSKNTAPCRRFSLSA